MFQLRKAPTNAGTTTTQAMNVFYMLSMEKILKNLVKKQTDLKNACQEVMDVMKKLEKNEADVLKDMTENPNRYFKPLELACATKKPTIVEPALDCLHKMMAYGYIDSKVPYEGKSDLLVDVVVATISNCFDPTQDDNVQLQIIKALLTAVTSCDIHGRSLRLTVKTCFNIHLVSKNEINRKTAQATLNQMLNIIFQRMESKPPKVKQESTQQDVKEDEGANAASHEQKPSEELISEFVDIIINDVAQQILEQQQYDLENEDDEEDGIDDQTSEKPHKHKRTGSESDEQSNTPVFDNQYQKDAFFIFRALCRLAMKQLPKNPTPDSLELKSRLLSLELIHNVLENSGPVFRTSETFIADIKQFLCLSLLRNCTSPIPPIFSLSLSIFKSLIKYFKTYLKGEIRLFLTNFLRILHSENSTYHHKMLVIQVLNFVAQDPQTLLDIFVNYDCALESINIYEQIVGELSNVVQNLQAEGEWMTPNQELKLKTASLNALVTILESLVKWMTEKQSVSANNEAISHSEEMTEGEFFEKQRNMKIGMKEGAKLFNRNPKKGIKYLIDIGKLPDPEKTDKTEYAEAVAKLLYTAEGFSKKMIGEYLGEGVNSDILHAFTELQSFVGMSFDKAFRNYLNTFRLPGEGQQIDRVVQKFAEKFFKDNGKSHIFANADACYVFAYSVIMLNTELHNPAFNFRERMSLEAFIANNRGINDGGDIDHKYQETIYNSIKNNEIKLKDDEMEQQVQQSQDKQQVLAAQQNPRKKRLLFTLESEKLEKETRNMLKSSQSQGDSDDQFFIANHITHVKSMMETTWELFKDAFKVALEKDKFIDSKVHDNSLRGLEYAIHITSHFDMATERLAFVQTLCHFTKLTISEKEYESQNDANHLHQTQDTLKNRYIMQDRHVKAIKLLLKIAETEGNYLKDSWANILECVSQLERLQSDVPQNKNRINKAAARMTIELTPEQINSNTILNNNIDHLVIDKIFVKSGELSDDAIESFVKGLCGVSNDEINPKANRMTCTGNININPVPRTFSLQKLIEVAHYNINRIKIVWSKLWVHMGKHFITVGTHDDLTIAMNAIDSLRQLSMKFLEQDELANYHFQRDFLKPFLQIIQQSNKTEIRLLTVECVGQMILGRYNNIKSGWKTILQIFAQAATCGSPVTDEGFKYVASMMKDNGDVDYFNQIQQNESFVDCVLCLTAFARNIADSNISLSAISLLKLCALHIVNNKVDAIKNVEMYNDDDVHFKLWFPILTGLASLISDDRREEVRATALKTMFEEILINRKIGDRFSPKFWEVVFTGVLFPVFDEIKQSNVVDESWINTTCRKSLSLMITLFAQYFSSISFLFNDILTTIAVYCFFKVEDTKEAQNTEGGTHVIERKVKNEKLAEIGNESIKLFVKLCGPMFTSEQWDRICAELHNLLSVNLKLKSTIDSRIRLKIIHTTNEIVNTQHQHMKLEHIEHLLDSLLTCHNNSKEFNSRQKGNAENEHEIEIEMTALTVYINICSMLCASNIPERQQVGEKRIIDVSQITIISYLQHIGILPYPNSNADLSIQQDVVLCGSKLMASLVPVIVSLLEVYASFSDEQFSKYLPKFYPLFTKLLLTQHREVRLVLLDLFVRFGKQVLNK
ncbi:hypothetical protein FDP41_013169 [Naegleria fowleri]|uniref:SEC7 domain-containing protein n=1 Tax=Naegleria fowleri TaxID=5763 RepID=A0A6A5BZ61_NAEFO|nr:uncharacterized protein FDP41_013169 [Naegleria fowleri]KAF0980686.1 hypothetical protein FDP41_013169 [Naegleria fowleri]